MISKPSIIEVHLYGNEQRRSNIPSPIYRDHTYRGSTVLNIKSIK